VRPARDRGAVQCDRRGTEALFNSIGEGPRRYSVRVAQDDPLNSSRNRAISVLILSPPFRCDIYSFGMTLLTFAVKGNIKDFLFKHMKLENVVKSQKCTAGRISYLMAMREWRPKLLDDEFLDDCPDCMKELIMLCWNSNEVRRPSSKEIKVFVQTDGLQQIMVGEKTKTFRENELLKREGADEETMKSNAAKETILRQAMYEKLDEMREADSYMKNFKEKNTVGGAEGEGE